MSDAERRVSEHKEMIDALNALKQELGAVNQRLDKIKDNTDPVNAGSPRLAHLLTEIIQKL